MSPPPEDSKNLQNGEKASFAWPAIAVIALLVILGVVLLTRNNGTGEGSDHPAVGTPLVDLQVEPLLGGDQPVALADLRGEVTLINFWGPWCHYCLVEMPHLVDLNQEFSRESDFRLLSISYGAGPSTSVESLRADSAEAMSRSGASWPVYHDPKQSSQIALVQTAGMTRGFGFPTTVLLDREGKIAGLWEGYMEGMEHDIQRAVQNTLRQ